MRDEKCCPRITRINANKEILLLKHSRLFASFAGLLLSVICGCSHLTVAPKPVVAHAIAFDNNQQNAGIIDCDKDGCLVTANFVAKYKQMEVTFKHTFADDGNIKPEGTNYRMPYDCVEHFTQMKSAERGP